MILNIIKKGVFYGNHMETAQGEIGKASQYDILTRFLRGVFRANKTF